MVRVSVNNGETLERAKFPNLTQGNNDIIKTTGAPEGVLAGMMTPGADETKGPVQFAPGQGRHGRHDATH